MEIIWSKSALDRVEQIGDFIAQDSSIKATQFVDLLVDSAKRLKKFPLSGNVTPENIAFRQTVFHGYRIIYRIVGKQIQIITVISPGLSAMEIKS